MRCVLSVKGNAEICKNGYRCVQSMSKLITVAWVGQVQQQQDFQWNYDLLWYFDILVSKDCLFQSVNIISEYHSFEISSRTKHLVKNWHIYNNIHEVYHFDPYFWLILIILQYLSQILIFFNIFWFILKGNYWIIM